MATQPQPPNDTLQRGLRTAAQVFVTALLAGLYAYIEHIDPAKGIPDLDALKVAGAMIALSAVSAVVAWLHNAAESAGILPTLGKPAPPAALPPPAPSPSPPAPLPPR